MPGPDSQDRNANAPYAVSRSYRTINGTPALVTIWSDGTSSAEAVDTSAIDSTSGGSSNSPAWFNAQSNAAYQQQQLAQNAQQFSDTMGYNKARGDQSMQLDQATQKWKEAVDARDFTAAEYWKARSQELQQNNLALNYTQLLASKSGPQDWVKYWKLSRGISPVPGEDQIPLDQALPAWARGAVPGTYPNSSGQAPGPFGFTGAQSASAQAPAPAQSPTWMQSAPGWQQPNGSVSSPTVADLAAHGPTTATTFTGANGVPIDFSGSEWMKKQTAAMPNWAPR